MSELKRYDVKTFDNYQESESGFWVRFQDVQKLQSQLSESQERVRELEEAARKVTGHNVPTSYDGEWDDAGRCSYCHGWNMNHKEDCSIENLGKLLNRSE